MPDADNLMKTGLIGLGAMGAPMAHNLYRAGYLAAAWNRSRQRLEAFLQEHPLAAADSPATVAQRARVLFTCVSADADLLDVVERLLPGLQGGAVLIDCSTVSRAAAVAAADKVAAHGAGFLDAPVSGGVEGARQGRLAMMVGGDAQVLEQVRPALEVLAAHLRPKWIETVSRSDASASGNVMMSLGELKKTMRSDKA